MTDISVTSRSFQVENRSWLLSAHGTDPGMTPSCTLDVSKFTANTHYPNGYIPSGTVLGVVTSGGKVGPYDNAASDGRQTAVGILFASVTVTNTSTGAALVSVGGAYMWHGHVSLSKMPFTSGTGFADSAGIADLPLIKFAA